LWAVPRETGTPEIVVDAAPLVKVAQSKLGANGTKLAQDVGRQTTFRSVLKDRQVQRWARIPEPTHSTGGTCAFCAMLAIRGPVYKQDTVDFPAHPGCECHPEPVFGMYVPSGQILDWQSQYADAAKGRTGAEARLAFRQTLEGRPVNAG
jgi:hypothetical protein